MLTHCVTAFLVNQYFLILISIFDYMNFICVDLYFYAVYIYLEYIYVFVYII